MPSSWPTSWPRGCRGAIPSGSGMMSRLRWGCCSIRTRTLRSLLRRGLGSCSLRLRLTCGVACCSLASGAVCWDILGCVVSLGLASFQKCLWLKSVSICRARVSFASLPFLSLLSISMPMIPLRPGLSPKPATRLNLITPPGVLAHASITTQPQDCQHPLYPVSFPRFTGSSQSVATMANPQKTYFLPPSWDYHLAGPLQLGNLILSPAHPAEALNGPSCPRPPSTALFPPTTKTAETWSSSLQSSGRYGIWTQALSTLRGAGGGAGAHVGFERAREERMVFRFGESETREFAPTAEFVRACLEASPAAVEVLRRSRFRDHLYMITAVKVVRGVSAEMVSVRERGVEVKAGFDGRVVGGGVPVKFGPEVRVGRVREEGGGLRGPVSLCLLFG